MTRSRPTIATFQLAALTRGLTVDVDLSRDEARRWVAAGTTGGHRQVGIGASARQALIAALASLRPDERAELLADPVLFGASVAVIGAETSERSA